MKYRAKIEKLNYKGEVIRTIREYEDDFKPDYDPLFAEFIKTGKLPIEKLKRPDTSCWEILRKIAPARSANTFDEYEPGIRAVAGEYCCGAGVQFICTTAENNNIGMAWKETDKDIIEN